MAAAAAVRRSISAAAAARSPLSHLVSKRFFFLSSSSHPVGLVSSPFAGAARLRLSPAALSHVVVQATAPGAVRLNPIWCRVSSGGSSYSSLNSGSGGFSDRQPTVKEQAAAAFPGCDYEHWLITMDKPGGEGATKQQMIDCYVQTLAKVFGSEEEAKKKIYNVSCEQHFGYFGFGCEIDEETSQKLRGLPGVGFVIPDFYHDVENKDYGAELFVNGEIVKRPPEREKQVRVYYMTSS